MMISFRKFTITLALAVCATAASAQTTVEERLTAMERQLTTMQQQMGSLSQRLVGVEQLNTELRKALDFGKPVVTAKGMNGVTYNVISLVGNKAEKTLTVTIQLSTTDEKVDMSFSFDSPAFVDLYGNRKKAEEYNVGGTTVAPVYKSAPVNGVIVFHDVEPETTKAIKLLEIDGQNNFQEEKVQFRDLPVEWK